MNISGKLKKIQEALEARNMANRVLLFDSWEAYEEALDSGRIRASDHCLIEDVPEDD